MWWPTGLALAGLLVGYLQVALAPKEYLASATILLTPCVVPPGDCRFQDLLAEPSRLVNAIAHETLSRTRRERIATSLDLYGPNRPVELRLELMGRDTDIHVLEPQPGDGRRVRFAVTFRYADARALHATEGMIQLFEYENIPDYQHPDQTPNRIELVEGPEMVERPPLYSSWYVLPARGALAGALTGFLLALVPALRSRQRMPMAGSQGAGATSVRSWRSARWLVLGLALGVLAGYAAYRFATPMYRASVVLRVPQRNPDDPDSTAVLGNAAARLRTVREQIVSRARLARALREEFNSHPHARLPMLAEAPLEETLEHVHVDFAVPPGPRGEFNLFSLSFDGENAHIALHVVERLVANFLQDSLENGEWRVRGLEGGRYPDVPFSPRLLPYLSIGALCGLAAGLAVVLFPAPRRQTAT
jgi:hypothetical protein